MLPNINIDITDISSQFSFSKEESDNFMKSSLLRIVDSFWLDWQDKVRNSNLQSTKPIYMNAMYREKIGEDYVLGLDPGFWLAGAVEGGISAFDEKEGFFKSSKAKTNKEGKKYFIIPFKFATFEAVATSQSFSGGSLPKEVHQVAKSVGEEGRQIRLSDLPEQYRIPSSRPQTTLWNGTVKEEYTHKSSIYEGIQKSNLKRHSGYVSFRTASELEPNAFIHTGIQARNLMGEVAQDYSNPQLIGDILDDQLGLFLESR